MPLNSAMPSNYSSIDRGGIGNGTVAAAAAAKKAQAARMALQQLHNQRVPGYYAISMTGLILVFTLFHWSRFMYNRHASKGIKRSKFGRVQVEISR